MLLSEYQTILIDSVPCHSSIIISIGIGSSSCCCCCGSSNNSSSSGGGSSGNSFSSSSSSIRVADVSRREG